MRRKQQRPSRVDVDRTEDEEADIPPPTDLKRVSDAAAVVQRHLGSSAMVVASASTRLPGTVRNEVVGEVPPGGAHRFSPPEGRVTKVRSSVSVLYARRDSKRVRQVLKASVDYDYTARFYPRVDVVLKSESGSDVMAAEGRSDGTGYIRMKDVSWWARVASSTSPETYSAIVCRVIGAARDWFPPGSSWDWRFVKPTFDIVRMGAGSVVGEDGTAVEVDGKLVQVSRGGAVEATLRVSANKKGASLDVFQNLLVSGKGADSLEEPLLAAKAHFRGVYRRVLVDSGTFWEYARPGAPPEEIARLALRVADAGMFAMPSGTVGFLTEGSRVASDVVVAVAGGSHGRGDSVPLRDAKTYVSMGCGPDGLVPLGP